MSSFNSSPVDSPVEHCPLCDAAWDKVDNEVSKIDGMDDVRERNRAISASYARLYQASPDLKWAGAAAFASKQVGCGMDTTGAGVSGAKSSLGAGNLSVYNELYPALRFYQQNLSTMSKAQIMKCMDEKPGNPLDPAIKEGLQKTMDGNGQAGAITMLAHEQNDTLQKSVYDSSWFKLIMDVNQKTGLTPVQYVVSADCTSPDPNKVVDFSDYPGNLYNAGDRWPFASDCAKKFVSLSSDPNTGPAVQAELTKIANAYPVP